MARERQSVKFYLVAMIFSALSDNRGGILVPLGGWRSATWAGLAWWQVVLFMLLLLAGYVVTSGAKGALGLGNDNT